MQLRCPSGHGELPVVSETWEWAKDRSANTLYTIVRVCHTCAVSTLEEHRIFVRGVQRDTPLPQPEIVVSMEMPDIVATTEGDVLEDEVTYEEEARP